MRLPDKGLSARKARLDMLRRELETPRSGSKRIRSVWDMV